MTNPPDTTALRRCVDYCYWATNSGDERDMPPLTQHDCIDALETLAALLQDKERAEKERAAVTNLVAAFRLLLVHRHPHPDTADLWEAGARCCDSIDAARKAAP